MSPTRLAASATFAAAAVLAASLLYGRITGATDPGAMDAMSIDMDTAGNTATSLGPWDECIIASPGDTLTIDVTATNIPASNPIIAFEYRLNYPAGVLTVESADPNFLLADLPGSSLYNLSDPVPDGDGLWYAGVADFTGPHENGSGVLDRMTLSVAPGAAPGVYSLALTYAYHGDDNNDYHAPNTINNAFIAVNTTCENLPTPSPSPVPTPTPPPTPFPWIVGDVDCSGVINWGDSLKISQAEVGLPVAQSEPCFDIGNSSVSDVDCDGYTNPRDALSIGRFIAALFPLSAEPGCPPIGTGTDGAPNPVPDGGTPTPGPNGFVVSVTSAGVQAGGQTSVSVHLFAPQPGASAYSIDVVFDPTLVAATSCSILGRMEGACNPAFAPNRVRIAGVSVPGEVGEVDLASITFRAGNAPGVSDLVPQMSMMLDPNGDPRSTTAISGSFTIIPTSPTPTPTATPMPSPAPAPVPGVPPPFAPGGVICFENLESAPECDGDTAPGAATDLRSKRCVGWNADCSLRDSPAYDSNFGGFVFFTPPEWNVASGNTVPIGAIAGRIDAEGTLGILNNACNSRILVEFTMLNASTNTGSLIPAGVTGDPMAPLARDANSNGVPDGADRYPAFLSNLLSGAQPRARLFGITHIQGSWVTVNTLVFDPGATLAAGSTTVTFNPAVGYPAITILQDPTAQAAPGWITDFCAPFFAQDVVLGGTINNPCAPVRVAGANCPVTTNVLPDIREHGYPAFPCDLRTTFDDDGDGTVNDGCPQYGVTAETGAECNNAIGDDSEDSYVNDGCPQVGDVSEGARIPGSCSGADEGGCTQRSNPAAAGPATFTTLNLSQRDADGDGIENSLDVCALVPNSGWNPRTLDSVDDPDNDGLPSVCDPSPTQAGNGSPSGCRSGYTGADEDQDCFSNRADNCPNNTQLQDPGLPPEYNTNLPFAPDQDSDGIGDICDPDPAAPNGDVRALCLKFALNVGGAASPVVGAIDSMPGPNCAAQPAGTPTPTPTPIPGPPIDIEASIDETGSVVPRDGVATIHGTLECDQPGLVELEVQVVQRAGRAYIVGVAEAAVWCYGHEEWRAEVVGNGRFVGGWVDVNVHAEAQAGLSSGVDDESARVRLSGGRGADR